MLWSWLPRRRSFRRRFTLFLRSPRTSRSRSLRFMNWEERGRGPRLRVKVLPCPFENAPRVGEMAYFELFCPSILPEALVLAHSCPGPFVRKYTLLLS